MSEARAWPQPARTAEPRGPVDDYLSGLHARIARNAGGEIATYIPELAKVDPDLFGIAIATVGRQGLRRRRRGRMPSPSSRSRRPSSTATRSPNTGARRCSPMSASSRPARPSIRSCSTRSTTVPFNPMVNAGAMADGRADQGRHARGPHRRRCSRSCRGSPAGASPSTNGVFRSEQATGHRNRAIAYMMLNSRHDPHARRRPSSTSISASARCGSPAATSP